MSRKINKGELLRERCGTPAYIAPEILREIPYEGPLVDVWSAGVVLYTMLYGNFPFNANSVEDLERLILLSKYELPKDISEDARNLLSRILNPNPLLRITIPEIIHHPWMKDVDTSRNDCLNDSWSLYRGGN